jgi:hypothetical protein
MMEPDPVLWTSDLRTLWDRIERHAFEQEDALDFVRRLAREHRWTLDFSRRAILEYRRFCFLAVTGSAPVTPSEEVDEVWHLHLTYSRDYWENWCASVLRKPLHHDPTRGGSAEQARFRLQYAATLARYEQFFGPSAAELWPSTRDRFRPTPRFHTLDAHGWLAIPRPSALWRRARQAARSACRSIR